MANTAITLFDKYRLSLGDAHINFGADTFKVMLSDTLPVKATAQLNTDITEIAAGNGYSAGGAAVPNAAYSLAVASYSVTDLATDATTAALVSSATHTFLAAEVGTFLQITSGTGFTAGYYKITAVSGGKATLDHAPGTTGLTGGHASHEAVAALVGDAVVFTAGGGSIGPYRYYVLYDATTGYLLGFWDYGAEVTTTNGNTNTLSENGQPTGGLVANLG